MKTVVIISVITFVLIFGGVVLMSNQLGQAALVGGLSQMGDENYEVAERVFNDLSAERDRIQRDKEELIALRQANAVQQQSLEQARTNLLAVVKKLEVKQQSYIEAQERSAARLAKMYEAMKPAKAAPILAALDPDIVIEIMSRMKERQAAKILASMDAGLAAQISTRLSSKGVQ
jgi:flagellar motility protein MotE (MotC chaperone)